MVLELWIPSKSSFCLESCVWNQPIEVLHNFKIKKHVEKVFMFHCFMPNFHPNRKKLGKTFLSAKPGDSISDHFPPSIPGFLSGSQGAEESEAGRIRMY